MIWGKFMENLNKYISSKMGKLRESNKTFENIFEIMHDQQERCFSEITDGYKIKKCTYSEIKEMGIKRAVYFNFDFYGYFECRFFGHAGFGYYSSITFLDCNFERVNDLTMYAFAEDYCEDVYILNEQTNNSLNFINVQAFNNRSFAYGRS